MRAGAINEFNNSLKGNEVQVPVGLQKEGICSLSLFILGTYKLERDTVWIIIWTHSVSVVLSYYNRQKREVIF